MRTSRSIITAAALLCGALAATGCIGGAARGLRNEQKGPEGFTVRGSSVPFYRPSELLPPGILAYSVAEVPKGYEPLLDLNLDERANVDNGSSNDLRPAQFGAKGFRQIGLGPVLASGGFNVELGNPNATHIPGHFGAAVSQYRLAEGLRMEKRALCARVEKNAQANLVFVHEVVSVGEPLEEVSLEPFGKVLSVSTSNGEITGETREPVYTVTIPAKHRLICIVRDPATSKELAKAVYATWDKAHKYYRNKDKQFFVSEEAALQSYRAERALFAEQISSGPMFETRKPKNLKDLPVTDLRVMSPEAAWGAVIQSDLGLWMALPPTGDTAFATMKAALEPYFEVGPIGMSVKDDIAKDSAWPARAIAALEGVRDAAGATPVAKAVAWLNIATLRAAQLDAGGAEQAVAMAQQSQANILGEASKITRGGVLDYGSDYYVARSAWLNIGETTRLVVAWKNGGRKVDELPAPKQGR